MKTAIFPGSFNPWHEGHQEILDKALEVFDKVIVAQGINPTKSVPKTLVILHPRVEVIQFSGLLIDKIKILSEIKAIVKGLRNSNDFLYEQTQQYWNEDLGIIIPTFYIISNRNKVHISSSAIKIIQGFKNESSGT